MHFLRLAQAALYTNKRQKRLLMQDISLKYVLISTYQVSNNMISTNQLAKSAATELLKEGVKPTQQNVRERIGIGSITTINKALNEWWQDLGAELKQHQEAPGLPGDVAERMQELWGCAVSAANSALEERRVELELEYKSRMQRDSKRNHEDKSELSLLRGQYLKLMQSCDELQESRNRLASEKQALETRLISLNAELDQAQRIIKTEHAVEKKSANSCSITELSVRNMQLESENKILHKQIDALITEKAELMLENRLLQKNSESSKTSQ